MSEVYRETRALLKVNLQLSPPFGILALQGPEGRRSRAPDVSDLLRTVRHGRGGAVEVRSA